MPDRVDDGSLIVDRDTGGVRILSDQCATCLLRAAVGHEPETVREVVKANLAAGTALPCHETLSYGPYPDFGEAACRGFFDRYRSQSRALRVAELLFGFIEVEPPPDPRRPDRNTSPEA